MNNYPGAVFIATNRYEDYFFNLISGVSQNDIRSRFKESIELRGPANSSARISTFNDTIIFSNLKQYVYMPQKGPRMYYVGKATNTTENTTLRGSSINKLPSSLDININYSIESFNSSVSLEPQKPQDSFTLDQAYNLNEIIYQSGPIFNMKNESEKVVVGPSLELEKEYTPSSLPEGFDMVFDKMKSISKMGMIASSTNTGSLRFAFFDEDDLSPLKLSSTVDTNIAVESYEFDVYPNTEEEDQVAVVVAPIREGSQPVIKAFFVVKNSKKVAEPTELENSRISKSHRIRVIKGEEMIFYALAYDPVQMMSQVWILQLGKNENGYNIAWIQERGIIQQGNQTKFYSSLNDQILLSIFTLN